MSQENTPADPFAPNAGANGEEYWCPWEAMNVSCGGYSSEVDLDAFKVLIAIRDGVPVEGEDEPSRFYSAIANHYGMAASHVELFQYMFCSADWCDYGGSPRGCWPNGSVSYFNKLIEAWKAYYRRMWGEEPVWDES